MNMPASNSSVTDCPSILKYNCNIPRYTSYPTAANFIELQNESYSQALKSLPTDKPLSLYFHIPFCRQLCWYCGCHTKITKRYAPVENYFHLLIKELRIVAGKIKHTPQISNIHFGGGSPNIIETRDFKLLMAEISDKFTLTTNAEISIEIDPRETSYEQLKTYHELGINRVSLGIQDFNKDVQTAINRVQSFELVNDIVEKCKEIGLSKINLDLIYGLPKQTTQNIKNNISFIEKLDPERIALFGYAHLPNFKKHMRLINEADLPSDQERLEIFNLYKQALDKIGYKTLGIDHFAKANDSLFKAEKEHNLHRNFQGYTTDNAETLIGIGASAISKLPNYYMQNIVPIHLYEEKIKQGCLAISKGCKLSKEDILRKEIIDNLMCYLEADIYDICTDHDYNPMQFEAAFEALKPLEKDGFVEIKDGLIKINKTQPQIARIIASLFDEYNDSSTSFSKVI